jgi:hypothetical protein
MKAWRLKLAPHKCSYTIFTKKKRLETEEGFTLKLYNVEIPRDNHPTFLGLRFDPTLSMNRHMNYVTIIRILSYYESWRISKKILVNIYISLTRSLFEYMILDLVDECKHFYNELQIDENLATSNYNIEMIKRDNSGIRESIKSNPITLLCHVDKLKPILWPEDQSNETNFHTF